jgi:uncharacterized protein YfaS (alpha-2-macroglobulin family)
MKKKYIKNILLFVFTVLFLVSFQDSDNFSFYLSSSKIYSSNEEPSIQVETYSYSGWIKFRAYKIDNPIEYFESLPDPHAPDIKNINTGTTFKILETTFNKVKKDLRLAARAMLSSESRKLLKELIDKDEPATLGKNSPLKDASTIIKSDVPIVLSNYEIVKEWNEVLPRNNDYWNYHTISIVGIKQPGVYLIEGKVGNKKVAYTTVVISDYAIITKNADKNFLTYVTNKTDGKAVQDFKLNFYMDRNIKAKDLKSDKSGLINYKFPEKEVDPNNEDSRYNYSTYLIMGYLNDQFIIAEPYVYSYYSNYNKYNVFLYTERPVYRPGQSVYFKGIIREKNNDGSWKNYPNKLIHIKVSDARGSTIYTDSLITNEFGSINGTIKIENEFPLGYYWIETKISEINYSTGFEVQEYKKPEYKVTVEYEKPYYIKGEELKVTVSANYYFGSPVTDAELEYLVYRSRYYHYGEEDMSEEDGDGEEYNYYGYGRELLESNKAKLNNDGTFTFYYHTDSDVKRDYLYTVVANVYDKSNRSITGTRSIKVMRGNFDISISTDKYVYSQGDDVKFLIEAADYKNNPIITNYKLCIYSYKYGVGWEKNLITTLTGSTNNDGEGITKYKINQAGYFKAEVTAIDKAGNEITSSDYVYVSSYSYDYDVYNTSNSIKIIPDKKQYSQSENISALVIIPYGGSDVLITAERDNIYYSKVEHFEGTSKVIVIPAKNAFSPNVFITASLITNNEFYTQVKEIVIPNNDKLLNISVENSSPTFKPGEKGKLTLQVTNNKNKPVKNAELSVGVVDESIYDIVPERTNDVKKQYYAKSYNSVNTSSSLYFSFYGYSREIRDEEYSDLYLKNKDDNASAQSERQRIAYGDVKGEKFAEPKIRKDFKDMIYWNPNIVTNSDGKAEIEIQYPDNLTTWRSTIRAITKETEVSSAINKVITRKDLIIRAEVPRFFVSKDEANIAVTVHNYTKEEKNVSISLTGSNIAIFGESKNIKIPKDGQVTLDFPVSTKDYKGIAKFYAKATTDKESDAVELSVPIIEHGIEKIDVKNIVLKNNSESGTVTFSIDNNVDLSSSKIVISASASPVAAVLNSLDDLIDYPYGCVEQTMSRFLPALIVQNSMKELGLTPTNRMKNELPNVISQGLKRLYSFQHSSDGGWGWWKDDDTDPFMTAYVVHGLAIAKQNGNSIDQDILSKAIWNLKSWLDNKKEIDITTKAYLIYSLAIANNSEKIFENTVLLSYINKLDQQKLNSYSKALIVLAYSILEKNNEAKQLYKELSNRAISKGDMFAWAGKAQEYNWQNDEVETTAFVLKAILKMNSVDSKIEGTVNYLLNAKSSNSWNSTKQTATVIYALTDYLKASSVMKTNYTTKVYNNDKLVSEIKINKDNLFKQQDKIIIAGSDLVHGENKIKFDKSGEGKLFATNRFVYFTDEENIEPSGTDFVVTRNYYKLQLKRFGNSMKYVKEPIAESVNSGDLILVKINLQSNIDNEYFMLEDPIASGYEPLLGNQEFEIADDKYNDYYSNYYYNRWLYSSKEFRDQKVSFFSSKIPKGNYEFSYIIQAQIPGTYHIMPAQAFLMYYPEVRGNSEEKIIKIN